MSHMLHLIAKAVLVLGLTLSGVWAAEPEAGPEPSGLSHGLLWRDSPLAAVFPLVVKTPAGRDYYLTVQEVDTGKAVLAAGITGGQFFKVLVPNGDFILDFAYGRDWQGEEAGFAPGPQSGHWRTDTPLHFGVKGVNRKAGHIVTLSEGTLGLQSAVKDQGVCQRLVTRWVRPGPGETRVPGLDLDGAIPVTGPYTPPRALGVPVAPGTPLPGMPYLAYGIRAVVCD